MCVMFMCVVCMCVMVCLDKGLEVPVVVCMEAL